MNDRRCARPCTEEKGEEEEEEEEVVVVEVSVCVSV